MTSKRFFHGEPKKSVFFLFRKQFVVGVNDDDHDDQSAEEKKTILKIETRNCPRAEMPHA